MSRVRTPGTIHEVHGTRLHLRRIGSGTPTVIIETGAGSVALGWQAVAQRIASFTTVVLHDRAGYGWSGPPVRRRTRGNISEELAGLLAAADLQGPYVLVGHSLGGIYARDFARDHPDEVVGMVLVDSSHEEQWRRLPPGIVRLTHRLSSILAKPWLIHSLRFVLVPTLRLAARFKPAATDGNRTALIEQGLSPATMAASRDEVIEAERTSSSSTRPLPYVPLVVLMAGKPAAVPFISRELRASMASTWRELQGELAAMSPRGELRIVAGAGHNIFVDKPDAVVDAVRDVVDAARGEIPGRSTAAGAAPARPEHPSEPRPAPRRRR